MSEAENEAAVRAGLAAWNANDWEALERLNASDIEIIAPEGWPESGKFEGWPAVRRQFERLKDSWSEEHVELVSLESRGDKVLVQSRWLGKGEGSGLDLDLGVWVVYTFEDGRIVRLEYFLEEAPARRAAGLEAGVAD
jgi:ketosteroid isomerase-like protein